MGRHARITEEGKENLLIHSLIQAISIAPFQVNWYLLAFPTQHGYTCSRLSVIVSESQAEAPQDSASEGVAHGQYVAARAEIQPVKCAESNSS